MRGSLKRRSKDSWTIILYRGYETDPRTGERKRKQTWVTVRGTRKQAEERLAELVTTANGGTFVEPSKLTLIAWLREWLSVVKPQYRPGSYIRYRGIIENHLAHAPIATIPLQKLRASHLEGYYGSATVSTVLHHQLLHRALRKAVKDRLVPVNVASDLDSRPRRARGRSDDAREQCWSADDAVVFLAYVKTTSPQNAALYALALDSGARKNELCGLHWADVEFETGKIRIVQQLNRPGPVPTFGPPKNGRPRTITIAAETLQLLRAHKQQQATLKLANRTHYHEHGLVFAKDWGELRTRKDHLGEPLQSNHLGERSFDRLITAARVKRIKFHGLRHTCATLLLRAGEPVHVVSERLGHSSVQITLDTYAHVLPDMQRQAAATLGALLHGGKVG